MAIKKKTVAAVIHRDGGPCVSPACERKVFGRGMCRRHWQVWKDSVSPACSVESCETPARAAGLCNKHWQRLYIKGTFDDPQRLTVDERFFAKVKKTESCWIWQGALFDTGYGRSTRGTAW